MENDLQAIGTRAREATTSLQFPAGEQAKNLPHEEGGILESGECMFGKQKNTKQDHTALDLTRSSLNL